MAETPTLIILDPYRAALTSLALDEGLAQIYPNTTKLPGETPQNTIGRDRHLRETVLQQLLLFDRATIIHHEKQDTAATFWQRHGRPMLSLLNLESDGLVQFGGDRVAGKSARGPDRPRTLGQLFEQNKEVISRWRPVLAEQMVLKGYIPDPSFFDVIVSKDLAGSDMQSVLAKVPGWLRQRARKLADSDDREAAVPVVFSMGEMAQVERLVSANETGTYVAMPSAGDNRLFQRAPEPGGLIEIVIHELMKDNIEFVLPESLRDVRRLRDTKEIVDFRNTFLPWLGALRAGNAGDEARLRREVRLAAMSFKVSRPLRTISKWSIVAPLLLELIGIGRVAEVAHIGLDWVTGRTERKGQWVGLCGRERSHPITQTEMTAADDRLAKKRQPERRESQAKPE